MEENDRENLKIFGHGALKMFVFLALAAAVGGFIYQQVVCSSSPAEVANENSPLELVQLALLLASSLLAGIVAFRRREVREGYMLVSALLACMAIRECDSLFDRALFHGAWLPFALAVAIVAVAAALAHRRQALAGIAEIVRSRHYGLLCVGFSVIFVFSRILGYKKIWMTIYRDICREEGAAWLHRVIKNISEEGTELFGYMLVFAWIVLTFKDALRKDSAGQG